MPEEVVGSYYVLLASVICLRLNQKSNELSDLSRMVVSISRNCMFSNLFYAVLTSYH
jgi:hypothetical protein